MRLLRSVELFFALLAFVVTHIRLYRIGMRIDQNSNKGDQGMAWLYVIAAIVAILLLSYLLVALFHAEKF